MTQAQKIAKEKFKKAIDYRKKTGVSLKEAFAHIYGKKVGAVKKKIAPKKKTASKKVASKRITDIHKDSKSHNVNIRVVSGYKKVGALPIDFKGNFQGFKFKVLNQYQLDGGVTAQLVELDGRGDIVAQLTGSTKENDRVVSILLNSAIAAGGVVLNEKDKKQLEKRIKSFVVGLNKEVYAYNTGKDTSKKKSKGLKIVYKPEIKKLAVVDQIKSILKSNKKILKGGYTLKTGTIREKKIAGFKIGSLYEFFDVKGLTDVDSLKKAYFKLAKVYHPDAGGTKEQFQKLQKEYEGLFKTIMSGSNLSANDIANEIELDENLRKAVDAIIGIPQLNLELIGKWIWVSGNTYPIRNELKNAGFMFAPVKKMWYYKGIESAGRGKLTIDEIRKKYGTQAIQKEGMKKIQGIGNISTVKKKKFLLSLKKALKALDNRKDQKIIISGIINKIH
jgi:hypothetical protein